VSGTEQKEEHFSLSSMDVVKAIKGLKSVTPKKDYDQKAMGLSPITSADFLIA
jgi:pyruvate/2-oxoglutarate/acetoin dehydrogenase E1 component